MGQSLKEDILQRLEELPEPLLRQVLSYVDNVSRQGVLTEEPVLAVAGILSGDALSAEEIERNLYGDGGEAP